MAGEHATLHWETLSCPAMAETYLTAATAAVSAKAASLKLRAVKSTTARANLPLPYAVAGSACTAETSQALHRLWISSELAWQRMPHRASMLLRQGCLLRLQSC